MNAEETPALDVDTEAAWDRMAELQQERWRDLATPGRVRGNGGLGRQLVAHNIAEFLALEIPPRPMLLAPVIPAQGLAMLYAPRGVGKTYAALSLAYAVATGRPFLRWSAPQPRRVLFVDGEMPAGAMQERLSYIVAGAGVEPPSADYFQIVTPDTQDEPIASLATDGGQDALADHLGEVELLVLDNVATLCFGGRENEAEGWLPVQHFLLGLRRRGLAVLVVHHAGKGGTQRGTSAREDVLDTVISLRRPDDYQANEGARFELHLDKARGFAGDEAKPFEARLEVRDGMALWTTRDIEDRQAECVRRLTGEGLSVREIANELGWSKSKVNRLQLRVVAGTDVQ